MKTISNSGFRTKLYQIGQSGIVSEELIFVKSIQANLLQLKNRKKFNVAKFNRGQKKQERKSYLGTSSSRASKATIRSLNFILHPMRNNLESLRGKWHNLILVLKCHSECCDGEEGGGKCQNRGTSKNNSELSK